MRIGVVSLFNPKAVMDFLNEGTIIPEINKGITAVNTLVREFLLQGHTIIVFTYAPMDKSLTILEGERIKIYILNKDYHVKGLMNLERIYMLPKLKKLIAKEINNIDVLHAHWTYDFALAAKKFAKRIPVFCSVRDWCPYILSMQDSLKGKIVWAISWIIFKQVMKGNSIHFIANSQYTYDRITKDYPEKQVVIIPNPISKDFVLDSPRLTNKKVSFISISQAAEDKRKNFDRLLRSFAMYHNHNPESELKLVGYGFSEDFPVVKRWKSQGLLEGVVLCGYVNHIKLMELIDESTCLIHPSLEETFGNIFLEGMARCIPVIGGRDSGAVPQVLGQGRYGILCDVTDVNSIFEAMKLTEDKVRMSQLTIDASEYIKENFKSDAIVYRHIELFKKQMNGGGL